MGKLTFRQGHVLGINIAKATLQLHDADIVGKPVLKKSLSCKNLQLIEPRSGKILQ